MSAAPSPPPPHDPRHAPVLLDEVIAGLAPAAGETHVDGTFGAGGYTRAILAAGATRDRVRSRSRCDRRGRGAGRRQRRPADAGARIASRAWPRRWPSAASTAVDGVTLDIGVSSMQLDRADRGFSFQADGPLDMRMEQAGESAADFLNTADEDVIADVLYELGEEPRVAPHRARDRRGAADRAHRRACRDRAPRARPQAARQEGSGDAHLPGDPHPPQPRARRARGRPRRRRARAEAGRAASPWSASIRARTASSSASCASAAAPRRPDRATAPMPARAARAELRGRRQGGPRQRRRGRAQSPLPLRHAARRAAHRRFPLVLTVRERPCVMMAARFRSVTWVGVALVPALACYLVTQHVAAERAELARVERQIGQTRRDIRELETEIGTRAQHGADRALERPDLRARRADARSSSSPARCSWRA